MILQNTENNNTRERELGTSTELYQANFIGNPKI